MMRREPVLISTVTAIPGEIDALVFNLHLGPVERYAGGVVQLLAFWLAVARFCALRLVARSVLRLVANNGVVRDIEHFAVQQTVAGEVERIDFDFRVCPTSTKPMSRLEIIASISSLVSAGTMTISACAGVTTPPIV